MTFFACIVLGTEVTAAVQEAERSGLLQGALGDRATVAWDLIRTNLDPDQRALFDAEATGLPPGILRAISDLVVTASDNGLDFHFESAAPDSVMEFARKRRVRFMFDVEEDKISVQLQHTMRHPTWLPEVVVPEPARAVAQSI